MDVFGDIRIHFVIRWCICWHPDVFRDTWALSNFLVYVHRSNVPGVCTYEMCTQINVNGMYTGTPDIKMRTLVFRNIGMCLFMCVCVCVCDSFSLSLAYIHIYIYIYIITCIEWNINISLQCVRVCDWLLWHVFHPIKTRLFHKTGTIARWLFTSGGFIIYAAFCPTAVLPRPLRTPTYIHIHIRTYVHIRIFAAHTRCLHKTPYYLCII